MAKGIVGGVTRLVERVTAWALERKPVRAFLLYMEHHGPMLADSVTYRALFAVFAGMTLKWRRGWLIFASATQLLTAASHFAFVIDPRLSALGFMTAYYLWSYATLAALAWGTYLAARRQ